MTTMLSNVNLERLIAIKRREIEKEKTLLGLNAPKTIEKKDTIKTKDEESSTNSTRQVKFEDDLLKGSDEEHQPRKQAGTINKSEIEPLPADLERYIRRYLGLPVMLRAGEYSPNNPLTRDRRRPTNDVFEGLGDYELRSNTLRRLRQKEYRQYLEQQAKLKQEAKEKEAKERLERERGEKERERLLQERERQYNVPEREINTNYTDHRKQKQEQERERQYNEREINTNYTDHRKQKQEQERDREYNEHERDINTNYTDHRKQKQEQERDREYNDHEREINTNYTDHRKQKQEQERDREYNDHEREINTNYTDHRKQKQEINSNYTDHTKQKQSERDDTISRISTHTVKRDSYTLTSEFQRDGSNKVDTGVQVNGRKAMSVGVQTGDDLYHLPSPSNEARNLTLAERELSPRTVQDRCDQLARDESRSTDYHDHDGATKSNRDKLMCDLRHTYLPFIVDGDAIQKRNLLVEQEAVKKKQNYQQELRNQIEEQQRIREERKAREKMLEEAEMRRLEEQLKMLRMAQERETDKQQLISVKLREHNKEFNNLRISLQKDIDKEKNTLFKSLHRPIDQRNIHSSNNENYSSKMPFYYPTLPPRKNKKPYSMNIPDNSIFSKNFDLEGHLKRNLNPSKESLFSNNIDTKSVNEYSQSNVNLDIESIGSKNNKRFSFNDDLDTTTNLSSNRVLEKPSYEPTFLRKDIKDLIVRNIDDTPIPVLRHSPKVNRDDEISSDPNNNESKMQVVENKWQVPSVEKNVLKSVPNDDSNKVGILTQLGSIRRQLQMEQLRLDKMLNRKVVDNSN